MLADMTHYLSIAETLAEELVDLRCQQTILKVREGELRAALLELTGTDPGHVQIATASAVVRIETRRSSRFDAKRLPDHIRKDPKYRTTKDTTIVRVLPSGQTARGRAHPERTTPDEFDVFERF